MTEQRSGVGFVKAAAVVALSSALAGCMGWVPGRQSYWDAKVKEMCEKDGGVTIYERVELSKEEFRRLGGANGSLPIPYVADARHDYPFFYEVIDSKIRDANPTVVQTQIVIRRRSDGKALGRSIQYFRRGGDMPTGVAQDSSFICPEKIELIGQVFGVHEVSK